MCTNEVNDVYHYIPISQMSQLIKFMSHHILGVMDPDVKVTLEINLSCVCVHLVPYIYTDTIVGTGSVLTYDSLNVFISDDRPGKSEPGNTFFRFYEGACALK